MAYIALYILIEGDDDERYFERIIAPILGKKYDCVQLWQYSWKGNKKIRQFIRSINQMGAHYLFIADLHNSKCVSARKASIGKKRPFLDDSKIVIVIKEIESWYLSGLPEKDLKRLHKRSWSNTEDIDKATFDNIIPKGFSSRINFMIELLGDYRINSAIKRNRSLRYLLEKHCW